jgi:replication factor A1
MKINELKPKTGNVELTAIVISMDAARDFDKDGKKGKVAKAVIKDETGECKLTLWNEETDKIKVGEKIKIVNGWANEWKGEIDVSAGKFGKIEVIERDETIQEAILPKKKEEKKPDEENIYSEDDEVVFDADDDDII